MTLEFATNQWGLFCESSARDFNRLELAWLEPTKFIGASASGSGLQIYLKVPSTLHKKEIETRFSQHIARHFRDVTSQNIGIEIAIDPAISSAILTETENQPLAAAETAETQPKQLCPLRFDNFLVGPTNEVAFRTVLESANAPGILANPIFLYGRSGVGKTHLLRAFGLKRLMSDYKVQYLTGENFLNDFVRSVACNQMASFRKKYRYDCDALIIDDIHTIGKGPAVQEELFNTLEHYFNEHKQILVSSDQCPRELKFFADRIKTRLSGGVTIELKWPDLSLRQKFIQQKLKENGLTLSVQALQAINNKYELSLREVSGVIQSIKCHALNCSGMIDNEVVKTVIGEFRTDKFEPVDIQSLISAEFAMPQSVWLSNSRARKICLVRQAYMLVCQMAGHCPAKIAQSITKDRTTVISGIKRAQMECKENSNFRSKIETILRKLNIENSLSTRL